MALEDFDGGNGIWLKIKHGYICQESKTEREGYKKVEGTFDGTPYKKWIKPYKAVAGFVNKVEKYDREHQGRKFRGWNIFIDADGTECVLEIPFDSRVNSRWMKLAESIDYSKPVRFSAWHDKKSDSMAFNAQQDGVSVPQKYTREDPGNMPEPVQRASGKWDYGAQEDFLTERMIKFVIPAVELAAANRNGQKNTSTGLEDNNDSDAEQPTIPTSNTLNDIKEIVTRLAGSPDAQGRSKSELLKDYFDTTVWAEIEKMPENLLKTQYGKLMDLEVPF